MKYIFSAVCLFLSACETRSPQFFEVEGTYRYEKDSTHMVLKIKRGGRFYWTISDNNRITKSQVGRWGIYDSDRKNLRLIIKGFCFPPGVSRANKCTDRYPAIIEKEYFGGIIYIPLDIDRSHAKLIKI
jgi:hypothetical protein